ncbi:MAG TPA: hypothetical protein ENI23_02095 [bacterium]|nr:hypothetical protein [bacterium]
MMSKPKFKVGEQVMPVRPGFEEDRRLHPSWNQNLMDVTEGKSFRVQAVTSRERNGSPIDACYIYSLNNNFHYRESWLEPFELKVGDAVVPTKPNEKQLIRDTRNYNVSWNDDMDRLVGMPSIIIGRSAMGNEPNCFQYRIQDVHKKSWWFLRSWLRLVTEVLAEPEKKVVIPNFLYNRKDKVIWKKNIEELEKLTHYFGKGPFEVAENCDEDKRVFVFSLENTNCGFWQPEDNFERVT